MQSITLELFRNGYISAGKGAEILGIPKWQFIQLLSQHGIDYVDLRPDELLKDVVATERILMKQNREIRDATL